MVIFNGVPFPGTHGTPRQEPWSSNSLRRYHFGLAGQTEKRGGRGGRQISVEIVLHNNYNSYASLISFLNNRLWPQINEHGVLRIDDLLIPHFFNNCTFEAFIWEQQPLPDNAGTIDGGWWLPGRLQFWQLKE